MERWLGISTRASWWLSIASCSSTLHSAVRDRCAWIGPWEGERAEHREDEAVGGVCRARPLAGGLGVCPDGGEAEGGASPRRSVSDGPQRAAGRPSSGQPPDRPGRSLERHGLRGGSGCSRPSRERPRRQGRDDAYTGGWILCASRVAGTRAIQAARLRRGVREARRSGHDRNHRTGHAGSSGDPRRAVTVVRLGR